MSLLAGLLPDGICAAEHCGPAGPVPLPAAERPLIPAAGLERWQSITGRDCARRAMRELGLPAQAIGRHPDGSPAWPAGVRGSLTHCPGFAGAAVSVTGRFAAVGVDAERPGRAARVLPAFSSAGERRWLAGLNSAGGAGDNEARDGRKRISMDGGICWPTVLFAAKEAAYKAWFPLTGQWLPMTAAIGQIHRDGTFSVTMTPPASRCPAPDPPLHWPGRWAQVIDLTGRPLVLAAVAAAAQNS